MAKTKSKKKRKSSVSSDSSSSTDSNVNKKSVKENKKLSNKKHKKERDNSTSSSSESSSSSDSSAQRQRKYLKKSKKRKNEKVECAITEEKRSRSGQQSRYENKDEPITEERVRDSGAAAQSNNNSGNNRSKWDSPVRSHDNYKRYNRVRQRDSGGRNHYDRGGREGEEDDRCYQNRYERNNNRRREQERQTNNNRDNRMWNEHERYSGRDRDFDRYRENSNNNNRRHNDNNMDKRHQHFSRNDNQRNRHNDRRDRSHSQSRSPTNRQQRRNFHRRNKSVDDNHQDYEWGKKDDDKKRHDKDDKNDNQKKPIEKEKPNFGLSGKLLEDTNMVNGVIVKYSEPIEARKPKRRWRLYPFKGETALPTLHIHRQSCFLVGRDRKVCDLAVDHPSCSKQHAALQYRLVSFEREDCTTGKRVRPYIIDLESANGTFLNNQKIIPKKYYELIEKDVIKFGFSSREYVVLHENSKEDKEDDDVKQEDINDEDDGQPLPKMIKLESTATITTTTKKIKTESK